MTFKLFFRCRHVLHNLFLCCAIGFVIVHSAIAQDYVGAEACQSCHQKEYKLWQQSDHFHAMALATPESVKGDFNNVTVSFHNVKTTFSQRNNQFWLKTLGDKTTPEEFLVKYTFGHYPLQQYLIETQQGHIQALNIAWDSRPKDEGGQRWFHLQTSESINQQHPFFWTKHFQNWNSRCAYCHSTNLQKNYSPQDRTYNTQWSEINVSCEACHGPAQKHIELASENKLTQGFSGFDISLKNTNQFVFNEKNVIAKNMGGVNSKAMEICATCHSRATQIGELSTDASYDDLFQLSTLDQNLYFADGQISDEVFVYGSFIQSKMHAAGVTCTNCHDAHSYKLKLTGDGVCLQCHKASEFAQPSHHHHKPDTKASACVSCHMPERTYMQVDDRRDHSFSIPRPALALSIQSPNVCTDCHSDWDSEKVINQYIAKFGEESPLPWASVHFEAQNQNVLVLRNILALAKEPVVAPIQKASLVQQLANFPARVTLEALPELLADNNNLIRKAAVDATSFLPADYRLPILLPLVQDKAKSVRMAVANRLADTLPVADQAQAKALNKLFGEYVASLKINEDSPGGLGNIGSFYFRQGDLTAAENAWNQALIIEPAYIPVIVNLADLYRQQGRENEAEKLLEKGLAIEPSSADLNHALGLLYVRQQNLNRALPMLKKAYDSPESTPRYGYVYGVALQSAGNLSAAISTLIAADKRWPNQPEALMALVFWMDEAGQGTAILPYLSKLSQLMPADPDVKGLIKKYAGGH